MNNANSASGRAPMSLGGFLGFLSLFAAICTIFALVVTIVEALREHAQVSWPSATATIQRCAVDTYVKSRNGNRSTRSRISCDIQYAATGIDVQSRLHSTSSSSDKDVSRMQQWVSAHKSGGEIAIRYNPFDSKSVVVAEPNMPFAGPHTPNNLKLLAFAIAAFVVLYSLARLLQRRETAPAAPSA